MRRANVRIIVARWRAVFVPLQSSFTCGQMRELTVSAMAASAMAASRGAAVGAARQPQAGPPAGVTLPGEALARMPFLSARLLRVGVQTSETRATSPSPIVSHSPSTLHLCELVICRRCSKGLVSVFSEDETSPHRGAKSTSVTSATTTELAGRRRPHTQRDALFGKTRARVNRYVDVVELPLACALTIPSIPHQRLARMMR